MQDLFIEFLPPWVETGLQPAFYDRESGTVLQQTARMYAKVNELVKAVNGMDKVIKEYVDYIDNYFKNLDVQEEINNKLDDMAEGGELAEYIAQYANLPCVHAYDTIADMASSSSLVAGSFARAMSKTVAGTGDGAYYKIREAEEGDTPDGENLVAITGTTLVAEIIPEYAINQLETTVSELQDEMEGLYQDELIVFGDSWSDLNVAGNIWSTNAATQLNCTLHNFAVSGAGFIAPSNNLISTQISNYLTNNEYDKTKARYIVVLAGVNDYNNSIAWDTLINTIETNIKTLKTACPQAKILYVNNYNWPMNNAQTAYWINVFTRLSTMLSESVYFFNQDGIYGKSLMNETLYHLTVFGQAVMANNICAKLTGGDITTYYQATKFENNDVVAYVLAQKYYDQINYTLYGQWKTNSQQTTIEKINPWGDASGVTRGSVGIGYSDFVYDLGGTYLTLARQGNTANESFITSFVAPLITEKSAV